MCGVVGFLTTVYSKFTSETACERTLKIGQYLVKWQVRMRCLPVSGARVRWTVRWRVNVSSGDVSGMESVGSRWRERSTSVEADYDMLQRVLIQRCSLARLCTSTMPVAQLHTVFEDWAAAARKAGRFQVISSFLSYLTHCHSLSH